MKRALAWTLIVFFVCLLIASLLKACEIGQNSERLENQETTQEETVQSDSTLPSTGGVRLSPNGIR